MSCPSPDSSTHLKRVKRKRKSKEKKSKESKKAKLSKVQRLSGIEGSDAIQNHAINSTQDVEKTSRKSKAKQKGLRQRFKARLKKLKLKYYEPVELNNIEREFSSWSEKHLVLGLQSLGEHVHDKKLVGKEIFNLVSKREFKALLPESLKQYSARDVRQWCLEEIEASSEHRLTSYLQGKDYESPPQSENEGEAADTETTIENEQNTNNIVVIDTDSDVTKENDSPDNEMEEACPDSNHSESVHKEQSDSELFQEIIKTPDQDDIDELIHEKDSSRSSDIAAKDNDDLNTQDTSCQTNGQNSIPAVKANHENEHDRKLMMLELELRARALQSFIKAKERKQLKNNIES